CRYRALQRWLRIRLPVTKGTERRWSRRTTASKMAPKITPHTLPMTTQQAAAFLPALATEVLG
ncbi:MAG TPA: hypothetical protein VLA64_00765, partial [Azonexus sp.]|nr:hypothetical protein [Azonexus sp.]